MSGIRLKKIRLGRTSERFVSIFATLRDLTCYIKSFPALNGRALGVQAPTSVGEDKKA